MTDLSVVIVSYNATEALRRCLDSLAEACGDLAWDAVVVDNASEEGTADMVAREFPEFRLIRRPDNGGFAKAANLGAAQTGGRAVCFLNSDARPRAGSLFLLVGQLRSHPSAGAVGPRLLSPDGRAQRSCFRFPSLARPWMNFSFLRDRFSLAYSEESFVASGGGDVDWLSGACLLARRDALKAAGFFDERFFMYFEDMDLCRRLKEGGWDVLFHPAAEVVHESGASSRRLKGRLARELQRSRLIYFTKHHPGPRAWLERALAAGGALWRARYRENGRESMDIMKMLMTEKFR
jgi:GT2 family glycosyltransferase